MLTILLYFIVAACAIIYLYFQWNFTYWKRNGLKTPLITTIPFGSLGEITSKVPIGVILQKHYTYFKGMRFKHGGIYFMISPFYMAVDLQVIKRILTLDFANFSEKYYYTHEPISRHLFSTGGEKWRTLRQKLTPTFTSGKMKMMFDMVLNCAKPLPGLLDECVSNHTPLNVKDTIARFSTDVIGTCAFGLECNSFKDPDAEFRRKGKEIFQETTSRSLKNLFTLTFKSLAHKLDMYSITPEISEFFTHIVKETIRYREENNDKRKDFLQLLINLKNTGTVDGDGYDEKGKITVEDALGQSFVFFGAGFETSSSTVTYCMYELAQNHAIQDKLRNEIRTVLQKYDDKITYEALNEMTYMQQVIDETLRKYPPLPNLDRKCVKDTTIPEAGYTIKAGTPVVISILGLHRDPDYFPNPDLFDPDRFSKQNINKIVPNTYFPFGEGPRLCIGKRFGIMQVKVAFINLLKNYQYTLNAKTPTKLEFDLGFILQPKGDVLLNIAKADD